MALARSTVFSPFVAAAALALALGSGTSQGAGESEAQVTVEGHRQKLERRVRGFVAGITVTEGDASLERWLEPVCPLVAGLNPQQGEGVLARITQIALKAGAKLAPAHCQPNLVIVVTPDPPALIESWRVRSQGQIFNGAAPMKIRNFIQTPRPVRVWYNTNATAPDGTTLSSNSLNVASSDPAQEGPAVNNHADDTRLAPPVQMSLDSVILVVDTQSIQHLTVGQVADYVGMVGLGRLDTNAQTGDAPTILNLFMSSGQSGVPVGLTQWDQAYLHALYHTPLNSHMQRSAITRNVVRDLEKAGE